jgi:hypothetical protein
MSMTFSLSEQKEKRRAFRKARQLREKSAGPGVERRRRLLFGVNPDEA